MNPQGEKELPLEKRVVLMVIDGLGDRVVKNGKTALGLADKPVLDELARAGSTGLMSTLGRGHYSRQ